MLRPKTSEDFSIVSDPEKPGNFRVVYGQDDTSHLESGPHEIGRKRVHDDHKVENRDDTRRVQGLERTG